MNAYTRPTLATRAQDAAARAAKTADARRASAAHYLQQCRARGTDARAHIASACVIAGARL